MASTPSTPARLVLLNGFPGVGKLTIARPTPSSVLFDVHLIVDPATALYPSPQPPSSFAHLRSAIQDAVLTHLRLTPDPTVVPTICFSADEVGRAEPHKWLETGRRFSGGVVWVTLGCGKEELVRKAVEQARDG